MELKNFVAETLRQIIAGVKEVQDEAESMGAKVNPNHIASEDKSLMWVIGMDQVVQVVEFDVAVTTTEGDKAKGGIGIFVGPLGVGVQGENETVNSTQNRIKFSVPVKLPTQE